MNNNKPFTTLALAFPMLLIPLIAHADPEKPLPLDPPKNGAIYIVAHRGAHEGIPENTLPAYQKAIDLGCDFVEIDLRTTKDGKFVSIHNSTIDKYTTQAQGPVKDMTLQELRALDIGSRIGPQWKDTPIPTLEEILQLCQGKIGIYLDLKDGPIDQIAQIIKQYGMENHTLWYVGAGRIPLLNKVCPQCIGMPDPGPELLLPTLLQQLKPRVVASIWRHHSASFVQKCHDAGAIVIADESGPECWEQALQWKTDGIQTDHPQQLIDFLKKRAATHDQ